MNKAQQIEEMARTRAGCGKADCLSCKLHRGGLCSSYANASAAYAAGYRKQSEGENEYKKLYEQLLDDFEHALHYAGKNNNVCNFCEHDCGESGVCKGRENWIECNPKWRGIMKGGAE